MVKTKLKIQTKLPSGWGACGKRRRNTVEGNEWRKQGDKEGVHKLGKTV